MNKTLKYALGAVLSLGMIGSAIAQENFPDVPENHWAFEALARMKKDGLLMGYPDGLFRGGRPATRYEMAVAIHATYVYLRNLIDDHEVRIKKLEGMGGGGSDDSWKAAVEALKNDIAGMKGWGESIADLKRMAATFEKELAAQGVDIEAMKKDLAALSARVDKLEKNKMPVTISGTVNLFATAGGSTSNRAGVGVDGSFFGSRDILPTPGGNITWAPVGMTQDFSVFHEALIKLAGTNEEGPKWWASLLVGNFLNSNAMGTGNRNYSDNYGTDIAIRNLVVDFDTAILGQGFSAKIGRVGYKISPYIYMMPDTSAYYDGFFDDGNWTMDGGIFGFNFGAAKFNVFAGRNSNRNSNLGTQLGGGAVGAFASSYVPGARPIGLAGGALGVNQTLGLHLNVPLTEKGGLDLAYLFHEGANGGPANRSQVYGGELNWDFGVIDFNAGYAKANLYNGKASIAGHNNKKNDAWHVGAAMDNDKFGLAVGYREIQPRFNTMGDWGRIGMWWNPNDIKGVDASVRVNLTEALTLKAKGGFYTGIDATAGDFKSTDKVNTFTADLNYQMANGWDLMLGAEFVDWSLAGVAGKPRERWYNIGLGYKLSDMAKLSILWQISDYDGRSVAGFNPIGVGGYASTRASGNLITTQFSVKF